MVQIAIMGHGVVGSGVAEILLTHKESLEKKAQKEIKVKYILDLRDFPDSPYKDVFTKDFEDIINDDDIKVVVEVMGGINPAFDFVKRCLEKGKSVVTSNKELVAQKGVELLRAAKENNANFLFEASVGGGIPIIRPLTQCLAANEVDGIAGILNGTTNFILTKMIKEQMSFDDALSMAQQLGYAERDPSADVNGDDACRKICILASLAFGKHIYPKSVHTQGITQITPQDVEYAASWGGVIKLIGEVKRLENEKMDIFVSPMFVSKESQLSSVDDVFNGILVKGDATGDVVFYGKGAGRLPTASAVVADVLDCIKHIESRKYLYWEEGNGDEVIPYEQSVGCMYVRAFVDDNKSAFFKAENIFGKIQKLSRNDALENEIAFVTPQLTMQAFTKGCAEFTSNNDITIANSIRIGDF